MVRLISALIGAFFTLCLLIAFGTGLVSYITEPPAKTVEAAFHKHPGELALKSDGAFGTFDRQQLQRGFRSTRKSARPAMRSNMWRSAT
jgi:ubiquinol-cytochrome c reductase cytochrome c1 subunit